MKKVKKENSEFDFRTIETMEDALKRVDKNTRQEYLKSIEGFNTPDERAYKDRKLFAKALRGDWEPDYGNSNQYKWETIFRWSSGSGFVFANSFYLYSISFSFVGSRLCFPSEKMSDHFGCHIIEIHRAYFTIQK